jgi:hypothetical protein
MAYINSPPTVKSLAPQGKRLPWVILAALLVLPFAAWGQSQSVSTFAELEDAIHYFNEVPLDLEIKVTANIPINSGLIINSWPDKTLTIKSDGTTRTLTRGVAGTLFTVKGGTLVFENIIIDASNAVTQGSIVFIDGMDAKLEMKNGAVLRGNTLTMDDGGGGVYVENGTFTMSGGEISGNSAPFNGGGVYIQGGCTFTMSGGEIKNNTATNGGGVYVANSFGTFFTMNGGTISGNTASKGGGVYIADNGRFIMSDGTISGNTVAVGENNNGGGVYIDYGLLILNSTAKIFGNTQDGNANNVYSIYRTHIELGTGPNAPQPGMQVYVQTIDEDGIIIDANATAEIARYFHADKPGKAVAYENGRLIIKNAIPTAANSLTAPATGDTPSTTATISNDANFTAGAVTWEGNPSVFLGTQYTATVTLTANNGYTFTEGLTATINGQIATISNNNGSTATLSYTFPATDPVAPPDEAIAIDITYSDGFFKKEEGLSTKNKTIFIASTTSCEISDAQIQITVIDPSTELLKINGETPESKKVNNSTRYNIPLEQLHPGFDTLFYDFSKEGNSWQDTAIIVSPIPFDKIIKQKWGLLIINHDPASNGGYKLTEEYNWFKNGEETGTTLPYYRLDPDEKIDTTNLFNVQLKTEDDIRLNTCEGSLTIQSPPEQQSAYKKQVLGINGKTANGKVYNIKGKFSTDNVPPGVYIVEEKQ